MAEVVAAPARGDVATEVEEIAEEEKGAVAELEGGKVRPLVTLSGFTARTEDRTLVMAGKEAEEPEGMMDCATPMLAALMVMLYNPALATFAKRHWKLLNQYLWFSLNRECAARFDDRSCQLYAPIAPFELST